MSTQTTHAAAADPQERDVIFGFNPDPSPLPDRPVHESIRRQALRTPHAIALRTEDTVLTYTELLDRAALVAARLADDGAGPGTVVGLCAQRGAAMVVSVLGILMSGAAYLPIDPRQPVPRSTTMLASARAALLLVDGPESPLADGCPLPVRSLDGRRLPGGAGPGAGATPLDWRETAGPDSFAGLACVVFTSGSTGEPKGVELTHLALANRLEGMLEAFQVGPDDVLLHKTPYTFDVSIWELLLAFMAGASLVVAPPDAHRDPQALVELITGYSVTMVHFVPSMLELFVTEPGFDKCVSLRTVLSGGEAASAKLINILTDTLPGATAYNMYGPAEATIDVTAWQCRRPEPGDRIPIGRPLSNVTAYVVDEQGGLAPVGTPGELLLGGACLASGYAGRPDLTDERFIEVDIAGRPERVYRTGDLAQWSAEGHLDYLGRIDTQVKIRGQRIELGEIEAALRRHPLVRNAVAVLRDKRSLVAYFVPATAPAPTDAEAELRAHLSGLLPEHMVPARIVELAEIPVNAHGKTDRNALPEPPRRRPRRPVNDR